MQAADNQEVTSSRFLSWDHEGVGFVKIFYRECKDVKRMVGDHRALNVQYLFANLKKISLMCNNHVQNWCRRKAMPFAEHPQSASTGKPIAVTADPQICGARRCEDHVGCQC